ncbi:MAG: DivIVA domain-containing protein [Actinobacteria bacterium]|nr:DivIVA domain-containing protein [Actinomycetota bacterium]
MEKNAEFIKNKEFHVVFKGYSPEEVDKFLDILSIEFERLFKKNRELQESLDRIKFESSEDDETDIKKIIQDALVSAHKVAEDIKTQAKKDAEEIGEKIRQDEEQALGDLKTKKAGLEESIIRLQTVYDEFKNRVAKIIDEVSKFISSPEADYVFDIQPDPYTDEEAFKAAGIIKDKDLNDESALESNIDETGTDDNAELKNPENEDEHLKPENNSNAEKLTADESLTDNESTDSKEEGLKRERKKIDIANPDIIENFFRTNE